MGSALVDNKQQLTPRSLPKGMSIAAPNPPNSSLYNLVLGHLHSDNECSIDVFITGLGMFLVSGYFLFSLSLSLFGLRGKERWLRLRGGTLTTGADADRS